MDPQAKAPNPKDAAAQDKVPLHVFPMTAILGGSIALFDGLLKYGLANYRATEVNASVYHAAALRHMFKWYAGETADIDSGLPHLWHAIACVAILIDADAAKTLIDDREYPSGFLEMMRTKSSEVSRLRTVHASRSPKHYDRRDAAKGYAPMPKTPREIARQYIIEQGGRFYREVLTTYGVETFSDLPEKAINKLATEASLMLAADPEAHKLFSQS